MSGGNRFFELNNGTKIPSIGLGTWKVDHALISDAITAAVKIGYRHIDCARYYGNEKEVYEDEAELKKLKN